MNKTEQMALVERGGVLHECFTHEEVGSFDVTEMRAMCKARSLKHSRVQVALDQVTPFVREQRVFEPGRVAALSEDSWKNDPGMYIKCPEPNDEVSWLLIDGSHRAIRREEEGETYMAFYVIELADAIRPREGSFNAKAILGDWGDPIIDGKIVRKG